MWIGVYFHLDELVPQFSKLGLKSSLDCVTLFNPSFDNFLPRKAEFPILLLVSSDYGNPKKLLLLRSFFSYAHAPTFISVGAE